MLGINLAITVHKLGDGRALLLGELNTKSGRYDIQLKGSGTTPYSRSGDGLSWLGPVLREYIVSEAMHHLGIPTTRSLAAVETGDKVLRETVLPGAILTKLRKVIYASERFNTLHITKMRKLLKPYISILRERHYNETKIHLRVFELRDQCTKRFGNRLA